MDWSSNPFLGAFSQALAISPILWILFRCRSKKHFFVAGNICALTLGSPSAPGGNLCWGKAGTSEEVMSNEPARMLSAVLMLSAFLHAAGTSLPFGPWQWWEQEERAPLLKEPYLPLLYWFAVLLLLNAGYSCRTTLQGEITVLRIPRVYLN